MSECVPESRRGLAVGIYTLGATVGAVLALPVIAAVTLHLPWRSIFLLDGAAGLLWVPLWFSLSRGLREIAAGAGKAVKLVTLRSVLGEQSTLRLMLARSVTDPVWYFFLFWFPKYLMSSRHMPLSAVSRVGWVVYLGAGAGTQLGSAIAGALTRRGIAMKAAYRSIMLVAAAIMPLSPFIILIHSGMSAAMLAVLLSMAHMAWLVALTGMILELYPQSQVGQAAGLIAMGSGLGGMLSSELIGYVVMHSGYNLVFCSMAIFHPLAVVLLWPVYRESKATTMETPLLKRE